jgi:hypothetical protein
LRKDKVKGRSRASWRGKRLLTCLDQFRPTISNPTGELAAFQFEVFEKEYVKFSLFVRKAHLLRVFNPNPPLPDNGAVENSPTRTLHQVNRSDIRDCFASSFVYVASCLCVSTTKFANENKPTAKNVLQQFVPRHRRLPSVATMNERTISSTADCNLAGSTGHAAINSSKLSE